MFILSSACIISVYDKSVPTHNRRKLLEHSYALHLFERKHTPTHPHKHTHTQRVYQRCPAPQKPCPGRGGVVQIGPHRRAELHRSFVQNVTYEYMRVHLCSPLDGSGNVVFPKGGLCFMRDNAAVHGPTVRGRKQGSSGVYPNPRDRYPGVPPSLHPFVT